MTDEAELRKLAEAAPTNGPDEIYLESEHDKYGPEGRLWCEDDDPSGSGYPWIKYVRHDIVAAKDDELTALRAKVKAQAKALAPFVAEGRKLLPLLADDDDKQVLGDVCLAHFRRAAQEAGHE